MRLKHWGHHLNANHIGQTILCFCIGFITSALLVNHSGRKLVEPLHSKIEDSYSNDADIVSSTIDVLQSEQPESILQGAIQDSLQMLRELCLNYDPYSLYKVLREHGNESFIFLIKLHMIESPDRAIQMLDRLDAKNNVFARYDALEVLAETFGKSALDWYLSKYPDSMTDFPLDDIFRDYLKNEELPTPAALVERYQPSNQSIRDAEIKQIILGWSSRNLREASEHLNENYVDYEHLSIARPLVSVYEESSEWDGFSKWVGTFEERQFRSELLDVGIQNMFYFGEDNAFQNFVVENYDSPEVRESLGKLMASEARWGGGRTELAMKSLSLIGDEEIRTAVLRDFARVQETSKLGEQNPL